MAFVSKSFPGLFENVFFLLLLLICPSEADSLDAIQVGILPRRMCLVTPFYDGQSDTILLFGGQTDTYNVLPHLDILSFSLSSNALEVIGQAQNFGESMPVFPSSNGTHLYYLLNGYKKNFTTAFKFNPLDGSSLELGQIPLGLYRSAFTNAPNGDLYVLGGWNFPETILKLDLEEETLQSEAVAELGQSFDLSTSVKIGNNAFIFGFPLENSTTKSSLIILDLETLESSDPQILLPTFEGMPSVVTTNRDEIFIVGGYAAGEFSKGLIHLNTTTLALRFLPVANFPLDEGKRFAYAPSSVYVEKLNRIYFFGGLPFGYPLEYENRIWFVELNSLPHMSQ